MGRDDECARIGALLGDAREQRSGALVLRGEPGIGKSALCAWAVEHADGMRVLSVTGVESEADLPFAGLASLCGPELGRITALPAPQARAIDAALARGGAAPVDRLSIGAAVLSLLAAVAADTPLLVVVDDAQWLDAATAHALRFAARRFSAEGIALLAATRPGTPFDGHGLPQLAVGVLDRAASRDLLAAEHGPLAASVVELLIEHSAGNPLALIEAPRALTPAQRAGAEGIDGPLPIGRQLADALLLRVTPLPAPTRQALLVAAASGGERLQPVLAALDGLGLPRAALEAAERSGVIWLDAQRFELRHPLLRSAVYRDANGPQRRAAHAALARVSDSGSDERAWHLGQAAVGEDEPAAAALEAAGLRARARGAPAAAAAALGFAARLSPGGESRVRRLTEAARDAHVAGQPTVADGLLDAALAESPNALARADIQYLRGRNLVLQGRTKAAYELLVAEAARIREPAPVLAAAMLAEACVECILSADIARAIAVVRDACALAAAADPGTQVFAATMLAGALVLDGNRPEASALLDRVLPALRAADPLTEAGQLVSFAAQCYFWLERDDVASELLAALIAAARRSSAPAALLLPLSCSAELNLRRGRWTVAAAQFQEAVDLGAEMSESVYAAYALQCMARLTAATGDERRCRDYAARATDLVERHDNEFGRLYIHSALGLLELGHGRTEAAIDQLERVARLVARSGISEPNIVHWQPDLIEAYARAGRRAPALASLAELERQAERTQGRWSRGTAARCRGLLSTSEAADKHFRASAQLLEAATAPFDVARTHLCRGERLRRDGHRREARTALHAAAEMFETLGAVPWAARAHAELRASGVSRRRSDEQQTGEQLTAHELRIARIVAEGASNRETAAALFLSPKTVEYHLASIYRKLGVRRRTELAAVAAARGWLEPPPPTSPRLTNDRLRRETNVGEGSAAASPGVTAPFDSQQA